MSLFDQLVKDALDQDQSLTALKPVVEKELLHHEILREMADSGLLKGLVFMGGTCLRNCYGSPRLSEDLDFSTGAASPHERLDAKMRRLGNRTSEVLEEKYGFSVSISEPKIDAGDTRTWKLTIYTRPTQPHLPAQRVHIDICSVPSVNPQPVMLKNYYQIDMGTSGLILQAETKQEILADKWVALAFRPNRIKQRDLWDIQWLTTARNTALDTSLVDQKIRLRGRTAPDFLKTLHQRINEVEHGYSDFLFEMKRFLPSGLPKETVENPDYWQVLLHTLQEGFEHLQRTA